MIRGYDISTALLSIVRSRSRSLLASVAVAVPLYILALFVTVIANLQPLVGSLRREPAVVVFLDDAGKATRDRIEAILKPPLVKDVRFVSKEEARERLGRLLKTSISDVSAETFPASYEASLVPGKIQEGERLVKRIGREPGVSQVRSQLDVIRKLALLSHIFRLLGAFLCVVLTLTAMLGISNTIRLVFLDRKPEIGILKLVGATDRFVKGPFLVEGMILGSCGGILALGLLLLTRSAYAAMAERAAGLLGELGRNVFVPALVPPALLLGGLVIGFVASAEALHRLISKDREERN